MPFHDFVYGLERVRQAGAALLQPLQIDRHTLKMETEEAARAVAVLEAVRALEAAVAPLCAPGKSPTLAEGRHALQTLQQRRAVQAAYADAYERALFHLCTELETQLDRQEERETQQGNYPHNA